MMLFRKPFDQDHRRFTSNPGRRFRDKMSPVVDSRGCRHLEKVGETDQYQMIQSYRDQVDLKQMIQRAMASGDYSAFDGQGSFGDFVGMPKDRRGLEDLRIFAENTYNSLTDEQKASVSFEDFLNGFSSQENLNALQSVLQPSPTTTEGSDVNES